MSAKCFQTNMQPIKFFPNSIEILILALMEKLEILAPWNPGAVKESFQWAARRRKKSQITAIQNHAEDIADEEFRYEINEKSRRARW